MNVIKKIQDMKQEMTRWRHLLHQEPELAFDERKTGRFLTRQLRNFGVDEIHVMAQTGIVAVLHGRNGPAQSTGGANSAAGRRKAIMLRSDMDALPMREETGAAHASRNDGVHHACGHDGHMAMLLGAAKHLAATRDFDGTVYFVFQPAEEHIGGAKEMIKEGLFKNFPCDEVYGLHNHPGLPLGMMATAKGAMLAQSDEFHISFRGNGGHTSDAAQSIDVVAAAAEAILAIKALAKTDLPQGKDGDDPAALAVCAVETDTAAANILPARAGFNGSLRTFDPALQAALRQKIEDAARDAAKKHGAQLSIAFKNGYPLLVNSDAQTDFAVGVAKELVGDKNVLPAPKTLGVEDFAAFLQQRPGNFMGIGTGVADGKPAAGLHTPKYDFNDAALPVGASYWVKLVEKALPLNGLSGGNAVIPPKGPKT